MRELVHDQAIEQVVRLVHRHDDSLPDGLGECTDAFLRGSRDDVLLLEFAAGLEEDQRDLVGEVILQLELTCWYALSAYEVIRSRCGSISG